MTDLVFVGFSNLDAASRGASILRDQDQRGVITAYALATVLREPSVRSVVIRDTFPHNRTPAAPSLGSALAGLVVLLGGLPAAAVFTTGCGMVSAMSDLAEAGLGAYFLERVAEQFQGGQVAVMAEIEIDAPLAFEALLASSGGSTLRSVGMGNPENEVIRCLDAHRALDRGAGGAAGQIAAPASRHRIDAQQRLLRKAVASEALLVREADAKAAVLRAQADRLSGEARVTVEMRANRVRSALAARISLLHQVIAATMPDLSPTGSMH